MELDLYNISVQILGELPPTLTFLYGIFTFIIAIAVIGIFFGLFKLTFNIIRGF